MNDKLIQDAIIAEQTRQNEHIELIASENFVSEEVLQVSGSILTNKYAEGYPAKRYYGGCENVDVVEQAAIDRITKLFRCKYANVQTHSGSQANFAMYNALLEPGDTFMGMALDAGGHLTHGFHVSSPGKYFNAVQYGVDRETGLINMDEVRELALEHKPKLIVVGASAYARQFDFAKFREIADEIGALVVADMAHVAGLIVADLHDNPFDYGIDVVTSTTHKTLRGARGGLILTNDEEIINKINKSVFPGTQGGPLMNLIAGKAVAFYEALQPEFKVYQQQVVNNAKAFAERLLEQGFKLITGGTDNHVILIDVMTSFGITGQVAEDAMHSINITLNKNAIPFDELPPSVTSGIRVGTPAMTTKGFKEEHFVELADIMVSVFKDIENQDLRSESKAKVLDLIKRANN